MAAHSERHPDAPIVIYIIIVAMNTRTHLHTIGTNQQRHRSVMGITQLNMCEGTPPQHNSSLLLKNEERQWAQMTRKHAHICSWQGELVTMTTQLSKQGQGVNQIR